MSDDESTGRVVRVRALLKRGGRTPVQNTIVRTEDVVATAAFLQTAAAESAQAHERIAESTEHEALQKAVRGIGAMRQLVATTYGTSFDSVGVPAKETSLASVEAPEAPEEAHEVMSAFASHATHVAALCCSYATRHRKEDNVENDIGHAISDAVGHLYEAYENLANAGVANIDEPALMLVERGRQLAQRARLDGHGEVFSSVEFAATLASFVDASSVLNQLYIGESLYANRSDPYAVEEFTPTHVAADSHARMAEALHRAATTESFVTNTLARAGRHASHAAKVMEGDHPAVDPLDACAVSTQTGLSLTLGEWVSEAMRTDAAEFDVLGGFHMKLDGGFVFHAYALDKADWLCLRARTTSPQTAEATFEETAVFSSTAAWRRLRYDAGTHDSPSFRPSEEQLRAAQKVGIALCGRGNLSSSHADDANLLIVDVGVAPDVLGMEVTGTTVSARATLHKARVAVGYMFSGVELERAAAEVQAGASNEHSFLVESDEAEPLSWVPVPAPTPTAEAPAAPAPVPVPVLAPIPEVAISAHEAFERAMHTTHEPCATEYHDVTQPAEDSAATSASAALAAAVRVTLSESAWAIDDLAARITQTAQASHVAALPDVSQVESRRVCAQYGVGPSAALYRDLAHCGGRSIDVAASMVGLRDLEPVVVLEEEAGDEYLDVPENLEAALEAALAADDVPAGSGTPSSEEFEDLDS